MATDFLVEIGTEELPPKALKKLGQAFRDWIKRELEEEQISFNEIRYFATPRRLAVTITDMAEKQADKMVEKLGPAVKAAYDKEGNPTKAASGFARSNGVTVDELQTVDTDKGERLAYRAEIKGKSVSGLLPGIVSDALAGLPIPKRMRWGENKAEFVRPVHWLVMLLKDQVIDCEIMGIKAGNSSYGHRFHHPQAITIEQAMEYESSLEKAYVVADFSRRSDMIRQRVNEQGVTLGGQAIIDEDLLDEVTALVEWPVPLAGKFEERFLQVPAEALISSMKEHQKYFHVVDSKGNLLPNFITVANIESEDPKQVIDGNERVIRPRLSDAAFFFETDKKTSLESKNSKLENIVFQNKLGSIHQKTQRIAKLAVVIAEQIGGNPDFAHRAAELSKADLVTEMVFEFEDLQGIMGYHYALHDGETEEVALALNEQYMPRFAGDELPSTLTGCAVALADRLDTLIGIFGIGEPPSGNKDPFALRRAISGGFTYHCQ